MNPYAPSQVRDLEKPFGTPPKAGRAARWFGAGLVFLGGAFVLITVLGAIVSVQDGALDTPLVAGFTWMFASALGWVVAGLGFRRRKPWRWFCLVLPGLLFIALTVALGIWSPE